MTDTMKKWQWLANRCKDGLEYDLYGIVPMYNFCAKVEKLLKTSLVDSDEFGFLLKDIDIDVSSWIKRYNKKQSNREMKISLDVMDEGIFAWVNKERIRRLERTTWLDFGRFGICFSTVYENLRQKFAC